MNIARRLGYQLDIGDSGDSMTDFVADGNYLADFSNDKQSIFADSRGTQEIISTPPFGNYAEISLGFNHAKTLESGRHQHART